MEAMQWNSSRDQSAIFYSNTDTHFNGLNIIPIFYWQINKFPPSFNLPLSSTSKQRPKVDSVQSKTEAISYYKNALSKVVVKLRKSIQKSRIKTNPEVKYIASLMESGGNHITLLKPLAITAISNESSRRLKDIKTVCGITRLSFAIAIQEARSIAEDSVHAFPLRCSNFNYTNSW